MLLKCSETQEVEGGVPEEQVATYNGAIGLRKILTGNKVKELRNLSTLAYKIKCKWENQVKKAVHIEDGGRGRTRFYVESIGYK
jgi:hypothetical protein